MTEPKHTPGQWEDRPQDCNKCHQIYAVEAGNGNGGLIAMVHASCEEVAANAQLIAAAPEMLEALKWTWSAWTQGTNFSIAQSLVRLAIAKAEGNLK